MQSITKMFLVFLFIFIVWTLYMENDISNRAKNTEKFNELLESSTKLERLLQFEREKVIELTEKIEKMKEEMVSKRDSLKIWKEPIPVLVFSCNRAMAVRDHVQKLIKYRPSAAKFPIIVSQDCDNERVRNEILKFGDKVQYIKHVAGDKVNITIPKKHKNFTSYYRIARHYRLALNHVLKDMEHTSVIITEDDLDISPDFFSYFSNTRYLLEEDPSLWCVTAWNDNGKSDTIDLDAAGKLYRSDFFAGLGWMMSSQTWQELEPIWPVSFWDDWMREGLRRKNRQCIRPEVSRTGMLAYGKHGASKGQFFNKHLSYVKVNDQFTNFGELDLDYLLPSNFEKRMKEEVYGETSLIEIDEVAAFISKPENKGKSVRVNYDGNIDFIRKADQLNVMNDFKAGVPRTAYDGIVTCFINGIRIYLVPDRTKVPGYISNWTVPDSFQD